jgi:hypothetical protein
MTLQSFVYIPGYGRVPLDFLPSGDLNTAIAIARVKHGYQHIKLH